MVALVLCSSKLNADSDKACGMKITLLQKYLTLSLSVNFSDSDKACGIKVLTKRNLPSYKKISPFHLSIEFENKCA